MVAITDGERLIGIMLADIMEHLQVKSEVDPSFVRKMLVYRDDWALEFKYGGMFSDGEPAVSQEVVRETAEIMQMMMVIETSVSQLEGEESSEFADERLLKFRGFDGNNDQHYGVAVTLVEDLNRFSLFAGRDLNSHGSPTAQWYLRQLKPSYDVQMKGNFGDPLRGSQLRALLSYAQGSWDYVTLDDDD